MSTWRGCVRFSYWCLLVYHTQPYSPWSQHSPPASPPHPSFLSSLVHCYPCEGFQLNIQFQIYAQAGILSFHWALFDQGIPWQNISSPFQLYSGNQLKFLNRFTINTFSLRRNLVSLAAMLKVKKPCFQILSIVVRYKCTVNTQLLYKCTVNTQCTL